MSITLRCQESKRERARLPISAARRRAHCRVGCRGDPTNATISARIWLNRHKVIEAARPVLVALSKLTPHHLVAPPALISPCRERVGLPLLRCRTRLPRCAESTRSSGSHARSGRRQGQYHSPRTAAACLVCYWTLARGSADRGSASRDRRFSMSQHGASVSLDIVGVMDGV
jgi:hypothetical protein